MLLCNYVLIVTRSCLEGIFHRHTHFLLHFSSRTPTWAQSLCCDDCCSCRAVDWVNMVAVASEGDFSFTSNCLGDFQSEHPLDPHPATKSRFRPKEVKRWRSLRWKASGVLCYNSRRRYCAAHPGQSSWLRHHSPVSVRSTQPRSIPCSLLALVHRGSQPFVHSGCASESS